jgi:5-hydroxyisourate hydrolase
MSQITTHVLDTALGRPAEGIALTLYRLDPGSGEWVVLASGVTNADGRVADFLARDETLAAGTYRMHFDTGSYLEDSGLAGRQGPAFYPWVDVVFSLGDGGEHYHIPLLLSPFGYSTYRGS